MYKQYHPYKLALIFLDFWITLAMLLITEYFRPFLPGEQVSPTLIIPNYSIYLFAPFLMHVLFALTGVYNYKRIADLQAQITRLTFSYTLVIWIFAGLLFFTFRETSRLLVIYFSSLNYIALVMVRYFVWRMLRKKSNIVDSSAVLIFGVGESAIELARTVSQELGGVFKLTGFSDFETPEDIDLPAPFLGTVNDLPNIIDEQKIEVVIVCQKGGSASKLESLVGKLMGFPVRIFLAPDFIQLALVEAEVEQIGNLVLIGIREPVITGGKRFSKRIMDIFLSIVLFLLTWPLLIVIWLAIKLDSRGPAIFSASRIGEGGKLFNMYKFRTMYAGSENMQQAVSENDQNGQKIYKVKDDPRVTAVGRFLRRSSLDELPQMFNVLRGDMSWVGPRPEQPFITKEYETWQWQRVLVPPGVTGWWQVSGRSDLPMHLNTNYDVYYVRNYSIILDLKILFRTVFEVLKGRGAY